MKFSRKVDKIALLGLIISIILGVPGVLEWFKITPQSTLKPFIFYGVPIIVILVFGMLVYVLIAGVRKLRDMEYAYGAIHRISHKLRDGLHLGIEKKKTSGQSDTAQYRNATTEESRILKEICTDIATLFGKLAKVDCHVGISLVFDPKEQTPTCFLWAYSNGYIPSRKGQTGLLVQANTRLKKVFEDQATTKTSRFYSPDVLKEQNFHDDLITTEACPYRCTIVVPLRCVEGHAEFLGFLKLETATTFALNSGWHVELLAGFADQIYLFLDASRAARDRGVEPPLI